jgi:hypothetical protein
VADYTTKVEAARAALSAQTAAQDAAKGATNDLRIALAAMVTAFSDIAKQVNVKASTAGDGVYSLANLPVPATPGPIGPLGEPNRFKVALDNVTGALVLIWKNTNPRGAGGATYQIYRRFGNEGEFAFIAGTGEKKFTDSTIPAGTAQVQYKIQAVRSTSVGPFALCVVNFGAGAPSVVEGAAARRIAA